MAVLSQSKYNKLKELGNIQYEGPAPEPKVAKPNFSKLQLDLLKDIKLAIGKIKIPENKSEVIVNPDTTAAEQLEKIHALLEKLLEVQTPIQSNWHFTIERDKYGRIAKIDAKRIE